MRISGRRGTRCPPRSASCRLTEQTLFVLGHATARGRGSRNLARGHLGSLVVVQRKPFCCNTATLEDEFSALHSNKFLATDLVRSLPDAMLVRFAAERALGAVDDAIRR